MNKNQLDKKSQEYKKLSEFLADNAVEANIETILSVHTEQYREDMDPIIYWGIQCDSSPELRKITVVSEILKGVALISALAEKAGKSKKGDVHKVKELSEDERNEAIELLFDPEILHTLNVDLGRRIVADENLRLTVLLTGLSAYGQNPLNLFLRGPSSSGKSFVVTETLKFFPKKDIWFIGRLSPTAIMHGYGETETIDGVDFKVIDMSQKILVFLESPNAETITQLLPVLSHDVPEIEIRVTNKNGKGQNKTENVIVRGAPVTIFCTTGGEILKDLSTRSIITAPEITKEKIEGVLKRQREEATSPWLKNRISPKFIPVVERSIELLSNHYKNVEVFIPDFEVLEMEARMDPRIQRDQKKLFELIKSSARLHAVNRLYRESKDGRDSWIEANYFDVITGLTVFKDAEISTTSGLAPFVIEFFRNVCVPLRDAEKQHTFSYLEMQQKYEEVYGTPLGIGTLRLERVRPLENAGYLTSTTDELDRRTRLFQILSDIPEEKTREEYGGFVVSSVLEEERLNNWIREVEKIGRINENISREFLDVYTGSDILTHDKTTSLYADPNMRWYFLKLFPVSKEDLKNTLPFKRESSTILHSLKGDSEKPSIGDAKNAEEAVFKNVDVPSNLGGIEEQVGEHSEHSKKPVTQSMKTVSSQTLSNLSNLSNSHNTKNVCDSCGRNRKTTLYLGSWLCAECLKDKKEFSEPSFLLDKANDAEFQAKQALEAKVVMEAI